MKSHSAVCCQLSQLKLWPNIESSFGCPDWSLQFNLEVFVSDEEDEGVDYEQETYEGAHD